MQLIIVTGFLGAGKTTFLQQALGMGALGRAALLVNEFGSADVDGALLARAAAGAPLVKLPNGCVCCQVQEDFVGAVQGLWQRVLAGELVIDRFVLETSGLADPAPLVAHLLAAKPLRDAVSAVHVVALVDGVSGEATLAAHPEARHQVACADLLVLSKSDQLDATALARWLALFAERNPAAAVMTSRMGVPEHDRWLDRLGSSHQTGSDHGHDPKHHQHHPHAHAHSHGIGSFRLSCPPLPSRDYLQGWLSALVLLHAQQLLRLKGRIALRGESQPLLLQGARDGMRLSDWPDREAAHPARTELIAIASGMDEPRWRSGLIRTLCEIDALATVDPPT